MNQLSILFVGVMFNGGIFFDELFKFFCFYSEVCKCVLCYGGVLFLVLILVNYLIEWLWEECECGVVFDYYMEFIFEQLILVGEIELLWFLYLEMCEIVLMDGEYIVVLECMMVLYEIFVVVYGEWEMWIQGWYFGLFDDIFMVLNEIMVLEVFVVLGIDYGSKVGK